MKLPWLPAGHTAVLEGRGEVFYRRHVHPDPAAPTLLLLHGWTASADLQFFTAYDALAADFSFVAIDHRGHGRGMRPATKFELEDVADDAAALATLLELPPAIVVGYSMGGPLGLLLAHRHPSLVAGLVLEATSLEWNATLGERVRWKTVRMISPIVRSWAYSSWLRAGLRRMAAKQADLDPYVEWLAGEVSRNGAAHLVHAGQALSHFDATPWAGRIGLPAGMLITTRDHLVKPAKQRTLAAALDAHVIEIAADHLSTWMNATEYAAATVALVHHVAAHASVARP